MHALALPFPRPLPVPHCGRWPVSANFRIWSAYSHDMPWEWAMLWTLAPLSRICLNIGASNSYLGTLSITTSTGCVSDGCRGQARASG